MRILIIGASGTIGKRLVPAFSTDHTVITAGRSSGDLQVDIYSEASIRQLFTSVQDIDACICVAASGAMDNFATLTETELLANIRGKLLGQVNVVLIGQHYLRDGGSFTLTSGVFADHAYKGVTGGGLISGALHSFVLSAAIELPRKLRINVVSPGMAADAAKDYGHLFPGLPAVPMEKLTAAYWQSVEGVATGEIFRVYE